MKNIVQFDLLARHYDALETLDRWLWGTDEHAGRVARRLANRKQASR